LAAESGKPLQFIVARFPGKAGASRSVLGSMDVAELTGRRRGEKERGGGVRNLAKEAWKGEGTQGSEIDFGMETATRQKKYY